MPEKIKISGKIKDGKTIIYFDDAPDHLIGLVELYFFNSIADSTSTCEEPQKPGLLTFYTNQKYADNVKVFVDHKGYGPFEPVYFEEEGLKFKMYDSIKIFVEPNVKHSYQSLRVGEYAINGLHKTLSAGIKVILKSDEKQTIEVNNKV